MNEIKKFATSMMHTKEVRIDAALNHFVWHKGIRNVPRRVRVKLTRKRNDDEDAKEKMLTYVRSRRARARGVALAVRRPLNRPPPSPRKPGPRPAGYEGRLRRSRLQGQAHGDGGRR